MLKSGFNFVVFFLLKSRRLIICTASNACVLWLLLCTDNSVWSADHSVQMNSRILGKVGNKNWLHKVVLWHSNISYDRSIYTHTHTLTHQALLNLNELENECWKDSIVFKYTVLSLREIVVLFCSTYTLYAFLIL